MDKSASTTTISILDVIQVVFIILKLCKVITWSWWWVLSPIWISLCLYFIFLIIYIIYVKVNEKK